MLVIQGIVEREVGTESVLFGKPEFAAPLLHNRSFLESNSFSLELGLLLLPKTFFYFAFPLFSLSVYICYKKTKTPNNRVCYVDLFNVVVLINFSPNISFPYVAPIFFFLSEQLCIIMF